MQPWGLRGQRAPTRPAGAGGQTAAAELRAGQDCTPQPRWPQRAESLRSRIRAPGRGEPRRGAERPARSLQSSKRRKRRPGGRPARLQRRCRSPAAGRRLLSGISSPATAVPTRLPPPPSPARKLCGRSPQARWEVGAEHLPARPACAAGPCCPPAPRSPPRLTRRTPPLFTSAAAGAGRPWRVLVPPPRCRHWGPAASAWELQGTGAALACALLPARALPQPAGGSGLCLRPSKLFHDLCCDREPPGAARRARAPLACGAGVSVLTKASPISKYNRGRDFKFGAFFILADKLFSFYIYLVHFSV